MLISSGNFQELVKTELSAEDKFIKRDYFWFHYISHMHFYNLHKRINLFSRSLAAFIKIFLGFIRGLSLCGFCPASILFKL